VNLYLQFATNHYHIMHSRGLHKKTDEGTSQIKNNIKKKIARILYVE